MYVMILSVRDKTYEKPMKKCLYTKHNVIRMNEELFHARHFQEQADKHVIK